MKTNLLIDGDYLLIKDIFFLFEEKVLYSELLPLLRTEIDRLRHLYNFDNVYFISDSRIRWRKTILETYKSNRVKDERIDWNKVYADFTIFKNEINGMKNIKTIEIDRAEGDDIIAYITKESNKEGYSNVIISADSDLHQLLTFDTSKEFINIMYNYKYSDPRTYLPQNYEVFIHEFQKKSIKTLFDMDDTSEFLEFIEYLISKTKLTPISKEQALFVKLISGDTSDCIPSVYIKNNRGIGKEGASSIYKLYKETYNSEEIDFDSDDFLNKAVDVVSYNKKVKTREELISIKENLIRNRSIIKLDEKYLPADLQEVFKNDIVI